MVQAQSCPADRIDEEAHVAFVYDGDTVRLEDGRKVRLAGVNTPELARSERPAEPLAEEALARLSRLLERSGNRVKLRYAQERYDRHGRLLAHLYLEDGSNVEALLLAQGLAQQLVVPPNDWQSRCYGAIEQQARRERLGIWGLDYFQPSTSLPQRGDEGRFRLVSGVVQRIAESRKSLWLTLDSGLALRVARADLARFEGGGLYRLEGARVVVRGYVRHDGRQFVITLRHPYALSLANEW